MRKDHLLIALLLLCLFAQTMAHARTASITFDEGPHLAVGYTTLRTRDLRLQPVHIHPPLANVLAAAALLLQPDLADPRSVSGWEIASLSAVTDTVVWQYPHPRRLAIVSRLPIVLMTLLLGAITYRWARDLFGRPAGLVALALYAFDPNVIAHGSLVTTDMAVALWGTAALFLTARALRRFRWGTWAGASLALGLALASKVSAASLALPIAALWLLGLRPFRWRRRVLLVTGGLALSFLVLWAVYGFELRPVPGLALPLPAATHLEIYRSLQEHYRLGHPAFLLGQNSNRGWWTYFPAAFFLKTPLPTLLLLAASAALGIRSSLRARRLGVTRRLGSALVRWGPLALFPLLYLASSLLSSVDIGYRHLLPVLPFLFIAAGRAARGVLSPVPASAPRRILLATLIGALLVETVIVSPLYLAYFNALAGGPAGGVRYLVDSNLDWGQDLWRLRDWMRENDVQRVFYAHFSPARPAVYGIEADFLPPDPRAVPFAPFDPAPGVYAIGATVLQGPYAPDVNTYAWFRTREPIARLGHALFVYSVLPRPAPTWAAVCAAPTPVLPPAAVRAGFGRPEMRVILLDCGQSWVYAAGGGAGATIVEGAGPPGAVLDLSARHADGSASYRVYRVGRPELDLSSVPGDVLIDGPLRFLGFRVDGDAPDLQQGTVHLSTAWEVIEVPARPLSLMAHLVGPDGVPVAVADGLGVPIEQWLPGDIILQRHVLEVPVDAPPGEYSLVTGAYWLDTMERWSIRVSGGDPLDQLPLTEITILR